MPGRHRARWNGFGRLESSPAVHRECGDHDDRAASDSGGEITRTRPGMGTLPSWSGALAGSRHLPDLASSSMVTLDFEGRRGGNFANGSVRGAHRGGCGFASHSPPSTTMIAPVIHPPAGEARKATMFAMSAGAPQRWSGMAFLA
jgi:hypothetical protein